MGRARTATAITATELSQRVPEPGTDEIGHLARTMNDMLARLDDSAARQRRFLADASHELRSPLTAIRPDRAPWPDIASRAARQTERLEALISQLLVLARADAGQPAARGKPSTCPRCSPRSGRPPRRRTWRSSSRSRRTPR
ncbi:HAMP domain-containing protein [Streptomyces rishiriensis]|uniref:HAMP domain-containing protein n=1 Tax=Streptomyces rishiriensis TaxID=68264 RepID=UPI0033E013AD